MSNKVKIKAENINFFYGKSCALKNISMDIYENLVTAIIG
ncbi:MAG TPA: phosphate ABC transporter ATP-binding protein, partial [Candidatus Aminicenantes bacterium]|nr:phosphate ABC transporter ATP-binding protein [Candidatus Aminicenantes bacterium]